MCKRRRAIGGFDRRADEAVGFGPATLLNSQLRAIERANNSLQQIIEIVRESTRKLANCFHFLCLTKLVFEILTLANVARRDSEPGWFASFVGNGRCYRVENRRSMFAGI